MKPISVTISGFRAWGKSPTIVEFPSGVIALTGDNEVGKTSLIESIMWALYGASAMREKQEGLIHEGLKDMSVTFVFTSGDAEYAVQRRYTLAGKTTLMLEETRGNERTDLSAAKITETAALIEELVGPYEVASRSWYSPQERGKLFFEANPAERRDVFGAALAIPETWNTWHVLAQGKLKLEQNGVSIGDTLLENMGEPDRTPDEIEVTLHSKMVERDRIKVDITEWEGHLEDGRTALLALTDADEKRDAVITQLFSHAQEEWATAASAIDERNDQLRTSVNEQTAHNQKVDRERERRDALTEAIENLVGDDCPTCHRAHTAESSVVVADEKATLTRHLKTVEDLLALLGPAMAIPIPEYEEKPAAPTREQFVDHENVPAVSDTDEITKVTDGVAMCRNRVEAYTDEAFSLDRVITNLTRDKSDAETLIAKRADTITARDAHAEEARHWETVYELTSPRGVRQLMIDQSLGSVQSVANEILTILQPGTEVYFDTQTETGRETLDLLLSAPDGVRTTASRSGGAGSRIATAIRCSLAMEAARSHGMPTLPCFFLDEVFDSNDADGKEALVHFLHWLSERVDVVLVISHDADILDSIEHHIHLAKPAGETIIVN